MISVIMANYNTEEDYLRTAIESVLNQTYKDIEIIIVDDCSTDKSVEIIESYEIATSNITLIKNKENQGLASSLNTAIKRAKGEFIARMDTDDVSHLRRFEKQLEFFKKNKEIDVLGTYTKKIGESNLFVYSLYNDTNHMSIPLFFGNTICHPTVMFRRDFFLKHSLFYNEEFTTAQDYELWSRVLQVGKIGILPEALLLYRIHNNQISTQKKLQQETNSKKIYSRFLLELGISEEEMDLDMHYAFCTGININKFKLEGLINWAGLLVESNKLSKIYDPRLFENFINYTMFKNALKLTRKTKKISLLKMKMMIKPDNFLKSYKYTIGLLDLKIKFNRSEFYTKEN